MPERFTPEEHRSYSAAPADSGLVPDEDEAPEPAEGVVDDDEDGPPPS
ncbi:MAG TPA: hypothetical protein VGB14_20750 [Acidimicrobiales bacterium]|jgi:hypothetical protein